MAFQIRHVTTMWGRICLSRSACAAGHWQSAYEAAKQLTCPSLPVPVSAHKDCLEYLFRP